MFEEVKDRNVSTGMIVTGAPVEQLPFEDVEYWQELCEIMEWSKIARLLSTFHICWGAQAGLYYHYGIRKYDLPEKKLFGVFPHVVRAAGARCSCAALTTRFMVPHSRHTTVWRREDSGRACERAEDPGVLASRRASTRISTEGGRQIFITGHPGIRRRVRSSSEYLRDKIGRHADR